MHEKPDRSRYFCLRSCSAPFLQLAEADLITAIKLAVGGPPGTQLGQAPFSAHTENGAAMLLLACTGALRAHAVTALNAIIARPVPLYTSIVNIMVSTSATLALP